MKNNIIKILVVRVVALALSVKALMFVAWPMVLHMQNSIWRRFVLEVNRNNLGSKSFTEVWQMLTTELVDISMKSHWAAIYVYGGAVTKIVAWVMVTILVILVIHFAKLTYVSLRKLAKWMSWPRTVYNCLGPLFVCKYEIKNIVINGSLCYYI